MAKVHLLIGNTGAGKSTYATGFSEAENAYILANDEWFKTLYMKDMPTESVYEWSLERTERIEEQMLKESLKLLKFNLNVILDIGFFKKSQRDRVKNFYSKKGIEVVAHYFDVSSEVRWSRVQKRNLEKAATFEFEVSKEIFDFCETLFEPLEVSELTTAIIIKN
ncbi:hypothetical protein A9Q84_16675 [Halobacteriovorax marinus]|uniref:ATP-binding protein n=1 Tax=Halobacteriovorax marinus TaxID=97084 RepID=A0A1Y5F4I5_9BACT|nr:hypothetical protein A9Q84_16675 [Halobacteriovorax marinus]